MKVKDLLSSHHKWCKDSMAKTSQGKDIRATDAKATRFCLLGAIIRCYPAEKRRDVHQKIKRKLKIDDFESSYAIADFNDNNDFKTVKRLVKKLNI